MFVILGFSSLPTFSISLKLTTFAVRLFGESLRIPAHEGVNSSVFGQALWLVNRSCTL